MSFYAPFRGSLSRGAELLALLWVSPTACSFCFRLVPAPDAFLSIYHILSLRSPLHMVYPLARSDGSLCNVKLKINYVRGIYHRLFREHPVTLILHLHFVCSLLGKCPTLCCSLEKYRVSQVHLPAPVRSPLWHPGGKWLSHLCFSAGLLKHFTYCIIHKDRDCVLFISLFPESIMTVFVQ